MTLVPREETFRSVLMEGGAVGSWCGFASFASVEAMTMSGFEFLVLDMQHCEFAQSHFPSILGAFPGGGRKPWAVVRAAQNDYHLINWLFDQGAPAVLVPMINSPELARRAVEAAKFPPAGRRSFGPFRAARYGWQLGQYMSGVDERSTLIVQIEDAEAARNIDTLLAVPGFDAVFMGPNDLAFSMLRPGESIQADPNQWSAFARTPQVLELCEHVMQRCRSVGMPFGMTTSDMDEARNWLERGASFVTCGSDFAFMRTGIQQFRKQRKETA